MSVFDGICDEQKYKIIPNALFDALAPVGESLEEELNRAHADSSAVNVFQSLYVKVKNDKKRRQIVHDGITRYRFAHIALEYLSTVFDPQVFSVELSILISDAGCMAQSIHCDFNIRSRDFKQGFFVLMALQTGTNLIVNDQGLHLKLETMNYSDMMLCRGDLVHGGGPYDVNNVRLHAYIDPWGVKGIRSLDVTYRLSKQYAMSFHFDSPVEFEPGEEADDSIILLSDTLSKCLLKLDGRHGNTGKRKKNPAKQRAMEIALEKRWGKKITIGR